MKVKKLIISVVASILLAAALTGCTGTTDNEGSAKSHTQTMLLQMLLLRLTRFTLTPTRMYILGD